MARYFSQDLTGEGDPPTPSTEALRGLQPMERHRMEAAILAQDRVVTQSRRILFRSGLNGDDAWLVPNTGQTPAGAQTHPEANIARSVNSGEIDVTPGCVLVAECLHLPSGQVSIEGAVGEWHPAGVQGVVHLVTTWTAYDATTESRTFVIALDPSTLEDGSENTSNGGMQKSYRLSTPVTLAPPVDLTTLANRNKWSRPHSVELEIRYVGSPRVVDLVVYEVPSFDVREADDPDTEWTSHHAANGSVAGNTPKPQFPVDEREDTSGGDADQRIGTLQALRVANNQRKRLGPMLFHWGAHTEGGSGVAVTTMPSVTISTAASVRWCNLLNTAQFATLSSAAAFEAAEPGWSMGCGGYARSWLHNNRQAIPDQNVATVPVLLRVLADNEAAATDTEVRFHTAIDNATVDSTNSEAGHSWISLTIPAATGTRAWHEAWGYLQVGINPEQHVVGQLLVQQETSGTDVDFYAVEAYVWDGAYAPIA